MVSVGNQIKLKKLKNEESKKKVISFELLALIKELRTIGFEKSYELQEKREREEMKDYQHRFTINILYSDLSKEPKDYKYTSCNQQAFVAYIKTDELLVSEDDFQPTFEAFVNDFLKRFKKEVSLEKIEK